MNDSETRSEELLTQAVSALLETPVSEDGLAEALAQTRKALSSRCSQDASDTSIKNRIWRTLMRHKQLALSSAAGIVICATVGIFLAVDLVAPSVAFSEVLKKMASVQTLHATMTRNGITSEIWAKRPNKLRMHHVNGTYEIGNGPTLWVVYPKDNKAVQKPSYFFRDAQRLGVDVLDMVAGLQLTHNFSGFFSQEPVETIERDGKTLLVYRMELREPKVRSEAFVDAESHLLKSLTVTMEKEGNRRHKVFAITILDVDKPMPDEKFVFKPTKGMKVTASKPPPPKPDLARGQGSTLSGRIVWASNNKPVGGAKLNFHGETRRNKADAAGRRYFRARARTDRNGRWELPGVPADTIGVRVRSWELEWPSVPSFKSNTGSLKNPTVRVDGKSRYRDLDFRVYRPEDFYARITINVTDEDGKPVAGASARLLGRGWKYQQSIYADRADRGRWNTGADGKFKPSNIWRTDKPVRIHLGYRRSPDPYATWTGLSKPFVVRSKQSYHFDLVLPFERQVKLKVVDRAGKPVEGLSVKALGSIEETVTQIFPLVGNNEKPLLTDSDGLVTIGQLAPGKEATVTLRRLSPDRTLSMRPLSSAFFAVKGPKARKPGEREVVYDDRPIRIEGTVELLPETANAKLVYVYCVAGRERYGWLARPKEGAFALDGVPPGNVRLGYRLHVSGERSGTAGKMDCEGAIRTEPGHVYTVKIIGRRVEVIGKRKLKP